MSKGGMSIEIANVESDDEDREDEDLELFCELPEFETISLSLEAHERSRRGRMREDRLINTL